MRLPNHCEESAAENPTQTEICAGEDSLTRRSILQESEVINNSHGCGNNLQQAQMSSQKPVFIRGRSQVWKFIVSGWRLLSLGEQKHPGSRVQVLDLAGRF